MQTDKLLTNPQFNYSGWRYAADYLSKLAAIATLLFLPINVLAMNVCLVTAVLLSIIAGNLYEKFNRVIKNPITIAVLMYFLLISVSALYSQGRAIDIGQGLHRYAKLLFIPLLMPLFSEAEWRNRGINLFLIAMLITLILSYAKWLGILHSDPSVDDGTIFKNHIETSFLMSFAAYIIALRVFAKHGWRLLIYVLLLALIIFQIYFINSGRTGYLISAALLILLSWQKWHWRGIITTLIIIPLGFLACYHYSSIFKNEIRAASENVDQYKVHQLDNNSLGLRLTFLTNSLQLIKEYPILGSGVGSFYLRYNKKVEHTPNFPDGLNDPHNEYLITLFQFGVVGLGLLLFLFWQIWRYSHGLGKELTPLAQAMLIAFAVGATCDSFLFLSTTGYFLVIFTSLFFAALPQNIPRANENAG
ncbi:MAG: O-antigen ligase family protein [Legionellales bacterium]|nr:O-antigen ligase family protein [Legionellales bacterium]